MSITGKDIATTLAVIVSITVIITAGYNFIGWVDDIYIDSTELQQIIDGQNIILNTMNNNIINIGSAIYDRKIDEIDRWIKELSARNDRNPAESAFLVSLKEQRIEVVAKKDDLSKIKVSF